MSSFIQNSSCIPIRSRLRRLMMLGILWSSACYLLFYISHGQGGGPYISPNFGRELLQQDSLNPDYIHEATTIKLNSLLPFLESKINIDTSPSMGEKELLKQLSKDSNLPLAYWAEAKSKYRAKDACSRFPSLYDLDFNNVYWQRMSAKNATYYLYGAYYDDRVRVGKVPVVRILGMVDKISPPTAYCQFWYDTTTQMTNSQRFSKMTYTYIWYKTWGNYKDGSLQPFIMTCPVVITGNKTTVPTSVSVVEAKCDKPTTNLKVVYKKPAKKQDFAVCVKGLDFLYEDISVRLVEWIELLNILGAKKIFLYELEMHPNISKVISHYIKQGLVELTPITLPGNQPNLPGFRHLYLKSKLMSKRQNELIPYNDCLYKNIHSYDYIALLDTDEVIMPLVHNNWSDLMEEVLKRDLAEQNYTKASYNFRNVYFLDDLQDGDEMTHNTHEEGIPRYLHMLQHVHRSKNYTRPGMSIKCFHNTQRVVSLHNHFPISCFGQCTTFSVNTSLGHLQHYRKDCITFFKNECTDFRNHTVRDTSIWRFKDDLIRRTTQTLSSLGFFKNTKSGHSR